MNWKAQVRANECLIVQEPGASRGEWNPYKEEELRQATAAAKWRWLGYLGVFVGLGLIVLEVIRMTLPDVGFSFSPVLQFVLVVGSLLFLTGLFLALPAEKAAKEARRLQAMKDSATGDGR